MTDLEGLSKAEDCLRDLQVKLIQRDEKLESLELSQVHILDWIWILSIGKVKLYISVVQPNSSGRHICDDRVFTVTTNERIGFKKAFLLGFSNVNCIWKNFLSPHFRGHSPHVANGDIFNHVFLELWQTFICYFGYLILNLIMPKHSTNAYCRSFICLNVSKLLLLFRHRVTLPTWHQRWRFRGWKRKSRFSATNCIALRSNWKIVAGLLPQFSSIGFNSPTNWNHKL